MQPETFDLKISAFSFNDVVGPSISFHSGWSRQSPNVRKACNFKAFKSLPSGIACWLTFQQLTSAWQREGRRGIFSHNEAPDVGKYLFFRSFIHYGPMYPRHKRNCSEDIITIASPWSSFIRYNPNQPVPQPLHVLSYLLHHNESFMKQQFIQQLHSSFHSRAILLHSPLIVPIFSSSALFYRPCNVYGVCVRAAVNTADD